MVVYNSRNYYTYTFDTDGFVKTINETRNARAGVGKYEILVTGIDHILSLCYIYISLHSIADFVSGGETSIYSLVIFSNVIIYIARIIIVSCNKDKKIKIFCIIVTGILGKATWFSILLKISS